jgi:hypothetical protein
MLDCDPCVRRPEFPTWSWTGWSEDLFESNNLHSVVLNSFHTVAVIYDLYPTLNIANTQDNWVEAISNSDTPESVVAHQGILSVLHDQQLPSHLNRESLNKLLVLDTLASKFEVTLGRRSRSGVNVGQEFDVHNDMTLGELVGSEHFTNTPYVSWNWFRNHLVGTSNSRLLEFIQIAKGNRECGKDIVYLIIVDIDE